MVAQMDLVFPMATQKVEGLALPRVILMVVGLVLAKEIRLVLMKDGPMELLMVAQMDLVFLMVTQKVEGLAFLTATQKVEGSALWKVIV